jgi:methionyl-tRNA synthetase
MTIQYEDFQKVEIKVGTVREAVKVEGADKLLCMQVDFGDEKRQIVSGIAEYFDPEAMVGKQCPFVTNLEPRTIRGHESQGMILGIKNDDGFALLHPSKEVPTGNIVG